MEKCERITRKMLRDMPRGTSKEIKIPNFGIVLSARNTINQQYLAKILKDEGAFKGWWITEAADTPGA